ncbi:M48 family metallopeptidase [Pseudoalteromonas fenneropenaei]|uniref:M48 family metallopeptidase n=1 Tax=Pseudoalteromonas fenneropenaei TaxID=1737459 RepID=A0ABV7CIM9_9GAMM
MSFPYQLRLSKKRKTVAIKIKQGTVWVYAPSTISHSWLNEWLASKTQWVMKYQAQSQAQSIAEQETKQRTLWLFGEVYQLQIVADGHDCIDDERKVITLQGEPEQWMLAKHRFLQAQLQPWLMARLAYWQAQMGMNVTSVKVRWYKSRWGSCDSKGRLTFNLLLASLPQECIDYVIVHELAHRQHLNHSPAFWLLVARYFPAYSAAKVQIRQLAKQF